MLQCLTGDNSDNIPGIKGIGPAKANKVLAGVPMERRYNRVKAAWRKHAAGDVGLSHRLLKMLTSWEEYEEVKQSLPNQTVISEPDVREERKDNIQDS
jgi:5'-3' exonuclease